MKQLVLGGFLLFAAIGIWIFSRNSAEKNDPSRTGILAGLTVALFSVGAFNIGGWLIAATISLSLNTDSEIFVRWLLAVPLILTFVIMLDPRRAVSPGAVQRKTENPKREVLPPGLRYYRQLRQTRSP
ncbi:MAG: hypothetical protein P4N41_19220 [Negativicutes bacterium]|nr:hypothetical protein [Negativicutes bacterium]